MPLAFDQSSKTKGQGNRNSLPVAFKEVSCGTELNIVQEGVPDVIPPEMCYLGWQESLISLANLVEVDIPG